MANQYPYDINASLDSNIIKNEVHTFPSTGTRGFSVIAIKQAPFHKKTFKLTKTDGTPLVENIDYELGWYYEGLSSTQNSPEIYMVVVLKNLSLVGARALATYHTVGAEFTMENDAWQEYVRLAQTNPTLSIWDTLKNRPGLYSTDPNLIPITDAVGWDDFIEVLGDVVEESTLTYNKIKTMLLMHTNNEVNAHQISLEALGLTRFLGLKKASLATIKTGVDNTQYLGVLETLAYLEQTYVPIGGSTTIGLKGPKVGYQGDSVSWTITDYDVFSEYLVESESLDLTIKESIISGTVKDDAVLGLNAINVSKNGVTRTVHFNIEGTGIDQPSLIGIMNNQNEVSVSTSAFSPTPIGSDTFSVAQYQISRTDSFSDVIHSKSSESQSSVVLELPPKTRLYIRARHIGLSGNVSNWSQIITFITGDEPLSAPILLSRFITPVTVHYYTDDYRLPASLLEDTVRTATWQLMYSDSPVPDWINPGNFRINEYERAYETDAFGNIIDLNISDTPEAGLYQHVRIKLNSSNGGTLWSNTESVLSRTPVTPPNINPSWIPYVSIGTDDSGDIDFVAISAKIDIASIPQITESSSYHLRVERLKLNGSSWVLDGTSTRLPPHTLANYLRTGNTVLSLDHQVILGEGARRYRARLESEYYGSQFELGPWSDEYEVDPADHL